MSPGGILGLLLLISAAMSSLAVDEGMQYVNNVGVYVYKSVAPFNAHIKTFIGGDLYNGAHYYVQGPYKDTYRKATATIILPPGANHAVGGSLETRGTRQPCICFSILAANGAHAVDMCVKHDPSGTGWHSGHYAGYLNQGQGAQPVLAAARVAVSITVKKTTTQDQVCAACLAG